MIQKYPNFWHYFIGDSPIGALLAFLTWAFIAATISILVNVINRDVASSATPVKTSWRFMLLDNLLRFLANLLTIPIFIRLLLLLFQKYNLSLEWMFIPSVVIGVCVDRLALWLKNLGILAGDRFTNKLKEKLAADDHIIVK